MTIFKAIISAKQIFLCELHLELWRVIKILFLCRSQGSCDPVGVISRCSLHTRNEPFLQSCNKCWAYSHNPTFNCFYRLAFEPFNVKFNGWRWWYVQPLLLWRLKNCPPFLSSTHWARSNHHVKHRVGHCATVAIVIKTTTNTRTYTFATSTAWSTWLIAYWAAHRIKRRFVGAGIFHEADGGSLEDRGDSGAGHIEQLSLPGTEERMKWSDSILVRED